MLIIVQASVAMSLGMRTAELVARTVPPAIGLAILISELYVCENPRERC